jgi:hypothetical protein
MHPASVPDRLQSSILLLDQPNEQEGSRTFSIVKQRKKKRRKRRRRVETAWTIRKTIHQTQIDN